MAASFCLTLLVTSALIQLERPTSAPERAKWDYRVIDYGKSNDRPGFSTPDQAKKTIDNMNRMGEDGWELVSLASPQVHSVVGGGSSWPVVRFVYYKRPRNADKRGKWEYTALELSELLTPKTLLKGMINERFDSLAKEGWELVTVVFENQVGSSRETYYHLFRSSKSRSYGTS
jgi:hypothetical protein